MLDSYAGCAFSSLFIAWWQESINLLSLGCWLKAGLVIQSKSIDGKWVGSLARALIGSKATPLPGDLSPLTVGYIDGLGSDVDAPTSLHLNP